MENAVSFSGSSALITGGLGFIGSNLAIRLAENGASVTVVDSLIPEYGGLLKNIAPVADKVRVNISDVRDVFSLAYLVRGHDFLFNLAGQTSHLDSMLNPFTDLEINCRAQLALLETCRKENPQIKIVFASTRQIYGKPAYLPVDEKHLVRPVDVNGVNKMAGESYHILYNNVYNLRACALRLTNTYGPRMRIKDARQTFVGIWIRHALESRPFEVWGGNQLRDFNFVDDVVDALLQAALAPHSSGKIYNLGSSEVISLKELAEVILKICPGASYAVRPFPAERKSIDIGDYYSDYALAGKELNWNPRVNLASGLAKTVDYFRARLQDYV